MDQLEGVLSVGNVTATLVVASIIINFHIIRGHSIPCRDGIMDQLERVLSVASGDQLAMEHTAAAGEWTANRTAAMAGVLHKLLHTYTETAISVTSGLITSITRFAVQVPALLWLPVFRCFFRWPARCTNCCTRTRTRKPQSS